MVVKMYAFLVASLFVTLMTAGLITPSSGANYHKYEASISTLSASSTRNPYFVVTGKSPYRDILVKKPLKATQKADLIETPSPTTEKIPVTTVSPTTTIEEFTFSQQPSTLAPAEGVNAENCIWEQLRSEYQYINVITNATWFNWYLNNCFPMHIGELMFFQKASDKQWTKESVPLTAPEIEQGCYFLKYYNSGAYIKVITNATWFSWYINNCFPKYQGVYLPFQDLSTAETTPEVQATTPDSCILEQYFPDVNYVKVITNVTWFDWYMSHCYPKYIGKILPLIPLTDYGLSLSTSTTYSPPKMETSTVVNTKVQLNFCSVLNNYIRKQSFTTITGSTWYPWYLYNCPETNYNCC